MIRTITIENFKSIEKLAIELGRVNVFIGANGAGKSNVLEAIAFASAASQDKLDHEFLASRGIRVTEPRFMRAAFGEDEPGREIVVDIVGDGGGRYICRVHEQTDSTYPKWASHRVAITEDGRLGAPQLVKALDRIIEQIRSEDPASDPSTQLSLESATIVRDMFRQALADPSYIAPFFEARVPPQTRRLPTFLVYAPENTSLRTFQAEGQILPLGIKGEGLFAHLKALKAKGPNGPLTEIAERLALIEWFERFEIPDDAEPSAQRIQIRDRYLAEGALFDQRSANEGFLFLLFYFTLLASPDTPTFFAVDNVDASLNPKLCSTLVREFVELSKRHDKQALLTTHNAAVLDGLNLHDDEQRLFVVERTKGGHTRVRRIEAPKPVEGAPPVRLSEAFLRGYIGGLPKNF